MRRQWAINTARRRLGRHEERPLVHSDLGFRFVCHPDWPDSVDQFLNNAGDHWEFALLRAWVRAGDTVFDIGANLGLYACAALHAVRDQGTVVAVDADPYAALSFFLQPEHTITGEQSLCPSPEQMKTSREVTCSSLHAEHFAAALYVKYYT